MGEIFKEKNYWALILGGSSGFGLASAKKLASQGMNIFIVHRDRKGSMERIEKEFEEIRENDIRFEAMNIDALSPEGQTSIIQKLKSVLAETGKIRLLLHSIAFGNLKLLVPEKKENSKTNPLEALSQRLGISLDKVKLVANSLFEEGYNEFMYLADPPAYNNEMFLEDEDIANTIYSMGTSIITWTKKIFQERLFDEHARILGLTSEGNEVAWKGYAAVSAAKLALESACRAIAYEMGGYGIRANVLQPGVTDTPALRLIPGSSQMLAHAKLRNPSGRLTTPEDVANVVYLMTLDESYWINGEIIRVDGGERIAG